ncbi:hypothetical protein KAFR_0D04090 [Kazachstania africana CBS 2517]|uniref:NADH:flavin oxidoreductase/NADH oxidase N-terminal domain-containing protein n=1 Tax=Kazachstania africana (strain ATCC 22294 / BCRC 22015 / CBS 2517 / CECT 1963 / NBRC 1671 / NRRL Y-8276) TaxID=1071382 RepID=H2AUK7_KAZAF|nr:hypothetical protein KAFR_0D04090 [Kazachstania africana CBS 2517]CCF58057.1 hypothetical protein KAFR_0D04090 [Kazachstania africana CBS 2517]
MFSRSVKGAPNLDYFTPRQPVIGSFIRYKNNLETENEPPALFKPLKIRSLVIPNRIAVAPMCLYSADNFKPTDFHQVHYGSLASRGPGLIIVECAAVEKNGRITMNDLGLWTEDQAIKHREKIVNFAHSQNSIIGIQLGQYNVSYETGQSEVIREPHNLSSAEIKQMIKQWGDASELAIKTAGYDFIEIQATHGHMPDTFCSSLLNKRNDEYGGSFENRTRFLIKVVDEIRSRVPAEVPIFVRLPDCEKSESAAAWKQPDTIKLTLALGQHGIDVCDFVCVNKGDLNLQGYCIKREFFTKLKEAHAGKSNVIFASIDKISSASHAEEILKSGLQDMVLIGTPFLKNPGLVTQFAAELNICIEEAVQYSWGFYPSEKHLASK